MTSIRSIIRKIIYYYYYIYWFKNATKKMFQDNNINAKKCDDQQDCRCAGAFCNLRSNEGKKRFTQGMEFVRCGNLVGVSWLTWPIDGRGESTVVLCFIHLLWKRLIMVIDIYRCDLAIWTLFDVKVKNASGECKCSETAAINPTNLGSIFISNDRMNIWEEELIMLYSKNNK